MRTGLTTSQKNVIDSSTKTDVSWLFEITLSGSGSPDYYYSTKAKTWNAQAYTFKILNFGPLTMKRSIAEAGLVAPSKLPIILSNKSNTLNASDFVGASITIRLVLKTDLVPRGFDILLDSDIQYDSSETTEAEIFTWCFEVVNATGAYQEIRLECRDWLQKYLEGDYPNTSLIKDLFRSDDPVDDNVCVPIMYGEPYFPIRSAYITDQRYYVLGPSTPTYTIDKVRSPRQWPSKSEWSSGSYTFTQSTKTGSDGNDYRVVQFIIADSDDDATADANGLFKDGERFLDVPCKYNRDDTSSYTNPGDIINEILQDFGIPSAKIDSSTLTTVKSTFSDWGLTWNLALWYKVDRKEFLAKLLRMCHLELIVRDKIYFKVHTKESQLALEKEHILKTQTQGKGTFAVRAISTNNYRDCGYCAYQESGEPIDQLQKVLVPAKSVTSYISNTTIECDYIQNNQNAQKIAQLNLQRLLLRDKSISFLSKGKLLALECDDVITINPADYGTEGTVYDILIDQIQLNKDLSIRFQCTEFSDSLDDFEDLTLDFVTVAADDSTDVYTPVMCGPDTTGITGSQVPNAIAGPFRVGNDTHYILIHPNRSSDRFIASGKSDFTNTDNGFILGIDNSDSDKVKFYLGASSSEYFFFDGTNIAWKGANTELDTSGNLTCTGGTIGGFTLAATTLTATNLLLDAGNQEIKLGSGNDIISLDAADATYRLAIGHATYGSAPFRVTKAGAVTATSGAIGGWTIAATTLASANITLDDGNDKITVNTITIDGANDRIRSGNYVAGIAGAGFTIEPDLIETGNIAVRGILRTAVFQKDVISAVGGNVLVPKGGDVLSTDMTAADASTLTIAGNETFANGDMLRIKDGSDDEWLEVTDASGAPEYVVTRDKNGDYGADSNPAWKKGATVVNYGASGDGLIHITASETNAPFISVYTHAGAPWSSITTRMRIGNLNGYLGYSSDLYGIGIGDTNNYIKYDPTNGLAIQINAADALTVKAGGDIKLEADAANPAIIKFVGTSNIIEFGPGASAVPSDMYLRPAAADDGLMDMHIGSVSQRWDEVDIYADNEIEINAYTDANNHARIRLITSSKSIQFSAMSGGSQSILDYYTTYFAPNAGDDKVIELGQAGGQWKALYCADVTIRASGTIKPNSMADAAAENDSIYYSTDQSKLVYKDSGGTVNDLY